MKRINQLKIALAKQDKTEKKLALAFGKNESTVSHCYTNEDQLSAETLLAIAKVLKISVK